MLILFLFWGVSNYAMENLNITFIYYGLVIGLLTEILSHFYLRTGRPIAFAICLPIVMLGVKMLASLISSGGMAMVERHGEVFISPYGWTIHATSGSIILACVMCALLAAAMHPPTMPDEIKTIRD